MDFLTPIAQASSGITDTGITDAGKAIALGVGAGLGELPVPRPQEAPDKRASGARGSIARAEKARQEADKILEEYRARLKEAREQADEIVARARKSAESTKSQAADEGREKREELL